MWWHRTPQQQMPMDVDMNVIHHMVDVTVNNKIMNKVFIEYQWD